MYPIRSFCIWNLSQSTAFHLRIIPHFFLSKTYSKCCLLSETYSIIASFHLKHIQNSAFHLQLIQSITFHRKRIQDMVFHLKGVPDIAFHLKLVLNSAFHLKLVPNENKDSLYHWHWRHSSKVNYVPNIAFFQLVGTYFLFCDTHFRADTDKSNCRMHPNKHKTSLHLFVSVVILYSFTLVCNTLQVKDDACKEGLTDSKHGWHGDNPLRKTLTEPPILALGPVWKF